MKSPILVVSLGLMLATTGQLRSAPLVLSLETEPANATSLTIGEMLTVHVVLSGLTTEELDSLGAAIGIDETVFGSATDVTSTSVVPERSDLFLTLDPDLVDALFLRFDSTTGIMSDGRFFSFSLPVIGAGAGTLAVNPLSISAEDANSGAILQAGDFTTNSVPFVAVPEPGRGIAALLTLSVLLRRRR